MTNYKELADRMEADTLLLARRNELIALLRSLDALRPTVDEVMALADEYGTYCMQSGVYHDVQYREARKNASTKFAELRSAIEALAAPVAAQSPQANPEPLSDEPNMFWNHDDPESPYADIGEFLNEEWCQTGLAVGDIRRVQRAIRLPDVMVRVTAVSDDGDIDYIVEPVGGIKERG